MSNEIEAIHQRYQRRQQIPSATLYDPLNPSCYMLHQEKRQALIRWINWANLAPVADKRLLEIGCGNGNNLSLFMSLGFQPENLVGNELIEEHARNARRLLPIGTQVLVGDASNIFIMFLTYFRFCVLMSCVGLPSHDFLRCSLTDFNYYIL